MRWKIHLHSSSIHTMSSFRPGPNIQLEVRLIGTVLAGIAYAIVAILFISCVRLKALPTDSRRLYRFRIFYIIIMFLLSTVALVQEVAVITVAIFKSDADHIQTIPIFSHFLLSESDIPSYLPFIIFGADMFMVSLKDLCNPDILLKNLFSIDLAVSCTVSSSVARSVVIATRVLCQWLPDNDCWYVPTWSS